MNYKVLTESCAFFQRKFCVEFGVPAGFLWMPGSSCEYPVPSCTQAELIIFFLKCKHQGTFHYANTVTQITDASELKIVNTVDNSQK